MHCGDKDRRGRCRGIKCMYFILEFLDRFDILFLEAFRYRGAGEIYADGKERDYEKDEKIFLRSNGSHHDCRKRSDAWCCRSR